MSYESRFLWEKGTTGPRGPRGEIGEPGAKGDKGESGTNVTQDRVEIIDSFSATTNVTVTDAIGGGTAVGTGSVTVTRAGDYLSLSLPTSAPPTIANNGRITTYYADMGNSGGSASGTRITDDGLAVYSFNYIRRSGKNYLQIRFLGGTGSGVINTII